MRTLTRYQALRAEWRKPGHLLRTDCSHVDISVGRYRGGFPCPLISPLQPTTQRVASGQWALALLRPRYRCVIPVCVPAAYYFIKISFCAAPAMGSIMASGVFAPWPALLGGVCIGIVSSGKTLITGRILGISGAIKCV